MSKNNINSSLKKEKVNLRWTKEKVKTLLECETDKQLLKKFPDFQIDILRRYQRKFALKPVSKTKIHKVVLLPDFHHPYHNLTCWNVVLKFLKWFAPAEVILVGDALEMRAIDHWKKEEGNLKHFEGKRLLKEYEEFIQDILIPIETTCPRAKKVFMGGNHEQWAYELINKLPQFEGMIEPEIAMKLENRGWQWIPYLSQDSRGNVYKGQYKIGKLTVAHGFFGRKYHAAATSEAYSKSCAYAHTHDVQVHTKVHEEDPEDYHTAQSIGCLCDKAPSYSKGKPNRWVHAFGICYIRPDGGFNLYIPIIIKGQFVFNGQLFKSDKKRGH